MQEAILKRHGREIAIASAVILYLLPLLGMDMTTA